jgi:integrase
MADIKARRGHGEDSIYFDEARGRWTAAVSLGRDGTGKRQRRVVRGKTKTECQRKLRELRDEIASGGRTSARYTLNRALDAWLAEGLDGCTQRTVTLYAGLLRPIREMIGTVPLRDLSAHDVRAALVKLGDTNSTRTLQITRNCLVRAIRHAEINDHVLRNVAALVKTPTGHTRGYPSSALAPEQAAALLKAAKGTRLEAYLILCLTTGIRTEEARALAWNHVNLDEGTVAVWRSVRVHGDVKTAKSRRTLQLPQAAVEALRVHGQRQLEDRLQAGDRWQDNGLVFASTTGTPLDRYNVRREFRKVMKAAGLGEKTWSPRELRHTFVSMLSAHGVAVEEIARIAGHSSTRTTEVVYRKELRPVITTGAEVMDRIFVPAAEA